MSEITNVYRQDVGPLRFIGKKYGDVDRVDGAFSNKWEEWFANAWFEELEKILGEKLIEDYADNDAYIGLMRHKEGEAFEYWIGMFMPPNTAVPEGFEFSDFPESSLGVCWVYGNEGEVYMQEARCAKKLEEEGYELIADEQGAIWFFERYGCPRFTEPDEKGNVTLDICHYIKP
ncbi:MAG: hypothetical protein FWG88_06650 [Oscillospiraceae bacterium]|nr:hypothetical protein [Oscillospiraceae bacterium]